MLRLILILTLVLLFLAFRFLPWWALLGILVILVLLWRFLLGWVFATLLMIPLRKQGKVLRGARVDVHSLRPTERPATVTAIASPASIEETHHDPSAPQGETEEADEVPLAEPDSPRDWFEIDITITPPPAKDQFTYWDIEGVMLVKPGSSLNDEDDSCHVRSVHLVREGVELLDPGQTDSTDEEEVSGKVTGPHRLKMLIGVQPGVRELVFRYLLETFGKLLLPETPQPGM
jgi:hypothetical protein